MAALAGNGPIAVPVDETRPPFHLASSSTAEAQLASRTSPRDGELSARRADGHGVERVRVDAAPVRVISQEEAASALREELERSSLRRELFERSHPPVLPAGGDRVVDLTAFDIEEGIEVAPGGVYEFWFSERGQAP